VAETGTQAGERHVGRHWNTGVALTNALARCCRRHFYLAGALDVKLLRAVGKGIGCCGYWQALGVVGGKLAAGIR
jgi:hypothetical protein